MAATLPHQPLADTLIPAEAFGRRAQALLLIGAGIALIALAAKIKILVPPSPVPVNLGTLAILGIGAAYGLRLGLATILGYLALGALGLDVFAGSSAASNGLAYMTGPTGGYLVGYVLAVAVMGALARRGWDRSVPLMALAMLIANVALYIPGLAWLGLLVEGGLFRPETYASVLDQTLAWGLTPYLVGDALKLALAALLLPAAWHFTRPGHG